MKTVIAILAIIAEANVIRIMPTGKATPECDEACAIGLWDDELWLEEAIGSSVELHVSVRDGVSNDGDTINVDLHPSEGLSDARSVAVREKGLCCVGVRVRSTGLGVHE